MSGRRRDHEATADRGSLAPSARFVEAPNGSEPLDRMVTISTPEGLDLTVSIAGFGTRFFGAFVDQVIQLALLVLLGSVGFVVWRPNEDGAGWFVAATTIAMFLTQVGYHILFELIGTGRSPGKRMAGIRVVRSDGSAVGLLTSVIRNLVRVIDHLFGFAVGALAVLVTDRRQRLGDLAADTLVVRDRAAREVPTGPRFDARLALAGQSWETSAVSPADVRIARSFLERAPGLDDASRQRIGGDLAARIRPLVAGAPTDLQPEEFLAIIVAVKATR